MLWSRRATVLGEMAMPSLAGSSAMVVVGSSTARPAKGHVWQGNTYKTIAPCLPAQ